jgi:hypothetical protein
VRLDVVGVGAAHGNECMGEDMVTFFGCDMKVTHTARDVCFKCSYIMPEKFDTSSVSTVAMLEPVRAWVEPCFAVNAACVARTDSASPRWLPRTLELCSLSSVCQLWFCFSTVSQSSQERNAFGV